MRDATFDDFSDHIGEDYEIEADGHKFPLKLEEAERPIQPGRADRSFRLLFRGPVDPVLPQAIYNFSRGEDSFEIFVVPVERGSRGTGYEAIFN